VRILVLLAIVSACTSSSSERPRVFGGDRAVDLQIPDALDDSKQYPLVLVLHGFTITGFVQEAYLGLKKLVETDQAFVVAPTGLSDSKNRPYWNADPACCDFDHANPDDVAYLGGLIDDIAKAWNVDRHAIYVVGHANGGYMAYRLACERADAIAGIVVIAGAAGLDPATCTPSQAVSVLHMHGTADKEFPYAGGGMFGMTPASPGAVESVQRWAGMDGCASTHTAGAPLDLDAIVSGPETKPDVYACTAPIGVELWTMENTEHLPNMVDTFVPIVWPWLLDHRR
jgi:polyhydroxybutyrate depolymerase